MSLRMWAHANLPTVLGVLARPAPVHDAPTAAPRPVYAADLQDDEGGEVYARVEVLTAQSRVTLPVRLELPHAHRPGDQAAGPAYLPLSVREARDLAAQLVAAAEAVEGARG